MSIFLNNLDLLEIHWGNFRERVSGKSTVPSWKRRTSSRRTPCPPWIICGHPVMAPLLSSAAYSSGPLWLLHDIRTKKSIRCPGQAGKVSGYIRVSFVSLHLPRYQRQFQLPGISGSKDLGSSGNWTRRSDSRPCGTHSLCLRSIFSGLGKACQQVLCKKIYLGNPPNRLRVCHRRWSRTGTSGSVNGKALIWSISDAPDPQLGVAFQVR